MLTTIASLALVCQTHCLLGREQFTLSFHGRAARSTMTRKVLVMSGDFIEKLELCVPVQALQTVGCTVHVVAPSKKKGDKVRM